MYPEESLAERKREADGQHSQLQQCPVRVGVGVSVLALVAHVILEIRHGLGVVPL